jgi:hypothetical protein
MSGNWLDASKAPRRGPDSASCADCGGHFSAHRSQDQADFLCGAAAQGRKMVEMSAPPATHVERDALSELEPTAEGACGVHTQRALMTLPEDGRSATPARASGQGIAAALALVC